MCLSKSSSGCKIVSMKPGNSLPSAHLSFSSNWMSSSYGIIDGITTLYALLATNETTTHQQY